MRCTLFCRLWSTKAGNQVYVTGITWGAAWMRKTPGEPPLVAQQHAPEASELGLLGLFGLLLLYVVWGVPAVKVTNFEPFAPSGVRVVFSTAGFVFVSYAGLLKVASVAEEVKGPSSVLPLGLIFSLLAVLIRLSFSLPAACLAPQNWIIPSLRFRMLLRLSWAAGARSPSALQPCLRSYRRQTQGSWLPPGIFWH